MTQKDQELQNWTGGALNIKKLIGMNSKSASKGRFDEFETNIRGPRAPQVEFSNTWHKICQKIEISTIHLMYSRSL